MIYNILIIGAGGIGKRHIKGYLGTTRATISIAFMFNLSSIPKTLSIGTGDTEYKISILGENSLIDL